MNRTYKTLEGILDDYCGSHINSQFYHGNGTTPMLLTERQLGAFSAQILTENILITLICGSSQIVFGFYFQTIVRYVDGKCKAPKSEKAPSVSTTHRKTAVCLTLCVIAIWTAMCSIFVMVHFFNDMAKYYAFVNNTVNMASNDAIQQLFDQSYYDVAQCVESGLGSIACPALFEPYSASNQPYTLQDAETVCWWIYNMLIGANPRIFQYTVLASFMLWDSCIYLGVMVLVTLFPCMCCKCCAWTTCWCACCCKSTSCCPVTRCCCHLSWCRCCDSYKYSKWCRCKEAPCCWYCLCG
eukprot:933222_1